MILVIAEKPSVARDIARVLKCSRKEGWFESAAHQVTWALGHLVTLKEPDEVDERYKKWRKEDLPILPEEIGTKVIAKTRSQFSLVKKLMNDKAVTRVVSATDAGREGELIFRLIYEQAGCKKPVDRLWISSLTDAAIREGFDALKPASAYDGLYQSALCRSQADWLVGMNASRAFTLQYNVLLSVAACRRHAGHLVERERRSRLCSAGFFHPDGELGNYTGQWFDRRLRMSAPRTASSKGADRGHQKAVKGQGTITKADTQPKRELPPQLFDLTSLQREANRALGFTADKTLKVAQSLYEGKRRSPTRAPTAATCPMT